MAMQGNESSTCCPYERPADVLRDYIKEPEGSSFHLTLPISGVLQSPHFPHLPSGSVLTLRSQFRSSRMFFCCEERIKNRLHAQQNRYFSVSLTSSVSPELCVITNTCFFPLAIEEKVKLSFQRWYDKRRCSVVSRSIDVCWLWN